MQRKIEPFYKNVGERLSEARKFKGYTQEELAVKIGKSREWVASVEQGRQKLYLHDFLEIEKITRVFAVPSESNVQGLIAKAESLIDSMLFNKCKPKTAAGLIVYMCQKEFQK